MAAVLVITVIVARRWCHPLSSTACSWIRSCRSALLCISGFFSSRIRKIPPSKKWPNLSRESKGHVVEKEKNLGL